MSFEPIKHKIRCSVIQNYKTSDIKTQTKKAKEMAQQLQKSRKFYQNNLNISVGMRKVTDTEKLYVVGLEMDKSEKRKRIRSLRF